MITLTPDEAEAYEKRGLLEAIKLFRNRTYLGLIESKRAIELWAVGGRQISKDGSLDMSSGDFSQLSEALTKLRNAEHELHNLKRRVQEVVSQVAAMASELPADQQEIWYRACGRMSNELSQKLNS